MSGETESDSPAEKVKGAAVRPTRPAPTVSVLRSDDLLALEFELVNLRVVVEGEGADATAALRPGDGDAFLVLRFPPQNVAEQAFFEQVPRYPVARPGGAQTDPDSFEFIEVFGLKIPIPRPAEQPTIPSRTLLSGPSRLVFRVPADAGPIPFTVQGLLEACSQLELSVPPVALPPDEPRRVLVVPPWVREALMAQAGAAAPSGVNVSRALMEQSKLRRWAASSSLARGASASAEEVAEAAEDLATRLGLRVAGRGHPPQARASAVPPGAPLSAPASPGRNRDGHRAPVPAARIAESPRRVGPRPRPGGVEEVGPG